MRHRNLAFHSAICAVALAAYLWLATAPLETAVMPIGYMFGIAPLFWIAALFGLRATVAAARALEQRPWSLRHALSIPAAALSAAVILVLERDWAVLVGFLVSFRGVGAFVLLAAAAFVSIEVSAVAPVDGESASERRCRRVRNLRRTMVHVALFAAFIAIAVVPALLLTCRAMDSALVRRAAATFATLPLATNLDYEICIDILGQCNAGTVDAETLGAELSMNRLLLWKLGFRGFRCSGASIGELRDGIVGDLERSSGEDFGADAARWKTWLAERGGERHGYEGELPASM